MTILLMEDPVIIPSVMQYLEHIDRTEKVNFEVLFATSVIEALARIADADIAIIGIEYEGMDIAEFALNEIGIPVIAMSTLPHDWESIRESKNLRFIPKPAFEIVKFTQAVRDFVAMIKNGQSKKQQMDIIDKRIVRIIASQIPIRN